MQQPREEKTLILRSIGHWTVFVPFYDAVLRIDYLRGVEVLAYADDLVALITADD